MKIADNENIMIYNCQLTQCFLLVTDLIDSIHKDTRKSTPIQRTSVLECEKVRCVIITQETV